METLFDYLPSASKPIPALPEKLPDIPTQSGLFHIVIDGVPVAKGRGRIGKPVISRKTGRMFTPVYTPSETRNYEDQIKRAARRVIGDREPIEEVVRVYVRIFLPIPKSMPKRDVSGALNGKLLPATKPDIDNYVKSALDGINNIIIRDDNQVAELHAYKMYSQNPRMEIEVCA